MTIAATPTERIERVVDIVTRYVTDVLTDRQARERAAATEALATGDTFISSPWAVAIRRDDLVERLIDSEVTRDDDGNVVRRPPASEATSRNQWSYAIKKAVTDDLVIKLEVRGGGPNLIGYTIASVEAEVVEHNATVAVHSLTREIEKAKAAHPDDPTKWTVRVRSTTPPEVVEEYFTMVDEPRGKITRGKITTPSLADRVQMALTEQDEQRKAVEAERAKLADELGLEGHQHRELVEQGIIELDADGLQAIVDRLTGQRT